MLAHAATRTASDARRSYHDAAVPFAARMARPKGLQPIQACSRNRISPCSSRATVVGRRPYMCVSGSHGGFARTRDAVGGDPSRLGRNSLHADGECVMASTRSKLGGMTNMAALAAQGATGERRRATGERRREAHGGLAMRRSATTRAGRVSRWIETM
jgi:hypothetical protein